MGKRKQDEGLSERTQARLAKLENLTPEEINQQRLAIKEANKRSKRIRSTNSKRRARY